MNNEIETKGKKIEGLRPDPEQLMARFPFSPHQRREGEPEHPTVVYLLNKHEFWPPQFWLPLSHEYKAVLREWALWAIQQPDSDLLFCDLTQRQNWFTAAGHVFHEDIAGWHKSRFELADKLRADGHGNILSQYWSHNTELQTPPPESAP